MVLALGRNPFLQAMRAEPSSQITSVTLEGAFKGNSLTNEGAVISYFGFGFQERMATSSGEGTSCEWCFRSSSRARSSGADDFKTRPRRRL